MTLILNSIYYIDIISFECHSQDAFSLLAYSNPWSSPMGWQLCPSRREIVCAALNSAILGIYKLHFDVYIYIYRALC